MRSLIFFLAVVVTGWSEEENSAQRLENAQKGTAEASWPRKPDDRLSPLSGKMKETAEISPRFYGQGKEFQVEQKAGWQKESPLGQAARWEGAAGRRWEDVSWGHGNPSLQMNDRRHPIQPTAELASAAPWSFRDLGRESTRNWASQQSRLGTKSDGRLSMYEGRLTRVRQQVDREERGALDLGPGKKETVRPEEVEQLLARPLEGMRASVTEQSAGASLHAVAGN